MESFTVVEITGQVIDNASDTGMTGLTVEVWDTDPARKQALASGPTDANGRFSLRFEPIQFKMETIPDLFFKVLEGDNLLTSTEDQIVWNAQLQENVTIYIVAPPDDEAGKDKYTGLQMLTITNFVRQSDFKGLVSQLTGTAGTSLGLARDMFVNTLSLGSLERAPITFTTKREDILGQPVEVASRNLKGQNIGVGQILDYSPGLNKASFSLLHSMPLNIRSGQTVDLYQKDGIVKYYALSSSGTTSSGSTSVPGAAEKDKQISKLQDELASLRKDHDDLRTLIQSKFPG
ncbi:MAG TPA: hypothetical protein VF939_12055 [Puia sp.]